MSAQAPAPDRVALREAVEQRAQELGFALVGVARAAPSARAGELRRFTDRGHRTRRRIFDGDQYPLRCFHVVLRPRSR
jgi:hypothetical protein